MTCCSRILDDMDAPFLALLDSGDLLHPAALEQVVGALQADRDCDLLYTDEDRLSPDGRRCHTPMLKPDWSPEMLLGQDCIGRLAVLRTAAVRAVGGLRADRAAVLDWDLYLRLAEKRCRIRHLRQCLYHRAASAPPGEDVRAAQRQVIREHLARQGLDAEATHQANGVLRLRWPLSRTPLVSIIIPSRNRAALIQRCIEGIRRRTSYAHLEILIVDNQSTEGEVLAFYRRLEAEGAARIIPFNRPFNYSAACNAGARAARGEMLLFLNNDTDVLAPDWVEELVRWGQRPGVGVVGTKLLYPSGRIQHAGLVCGLVSIVSIAYYGLPGSHADVLGGVDSYRNYLAVTGACQLLPRRVFDKIGGFDEDYLLTHSDVAICIRAWKAGYRIVYTPFAALVHDESASRGDFAPTDDGRLMARQLAAWGVTGDPYYHPGWNADAMTLTPRAGRERSAEHVLRDSLTALLQADNLAAPLDWHDRQFRNTLRQQHGLRLDDWSPGDAEGDEEGAARAVLRILHDHPDLRRRFPLALSEGEAGGFHRWLASEGRPRLSLSDRALQHIRAVLAARPSHRVRQAYEADAAARAAYPLALLPCGQRRFLDWLCATGRRRYALSDAMIVWFLEECAEQPARELARTYQLTPEWQMRFPDALTSPRWSDFCSWVCRRFGIDRI
jgi:GT2 family glycosyltransferase